LSVTNVTTPFKRRPDDAAAPAGPEAGVTRDPKSRAGADGPRDEAHARLDAALDEALNETFPASDPTAVHLPDAG
jgi:hypothetical protein